MPTQSPKPSSAQLRSTSTQHLPHPNTTPTCAAHTHTHTAHSHACLVTCAHTCTHVGIQLCACMTHAWACHHTHAHTCPRLTLFPPGASLGLARPALLLHPTSPCPSLGPQPWAPVLRVSVTELYHSCFPISPPTDQRPNRFSFMVVTDSSLPASRGLVQVSPGKLSRLRVSHIHLPRT